MFQQDQAEQVYLESEYHWIWRAWDRLTDERQWQTRGIGVPMGGTIITPFPCRIPWTSVMAWCEVNDYDESTSRMLDDCLLAMDQVFIAWWIETNKIKG